MGIKPIELPGNVMEVESVPENDRQEQFEIDGKEQKTSSLLADCYTFSGNQYYYSQLDPHVGDPDYKPFKARTVIVKIVAPARGFQRIRSEKSLCDQIMEKVRHGHRERDTLAVYVPEYKKDGELHEPTVILAITGKSPMRLTAINKSLDGVGRYREIIPTTRAEALDSITQILRAAENIALATGREDRVGRLGPFESGKFEPPKTGGRPKKKRRKQAPKRTTKGKTTSNKTIKGAPKTETPRTPATPATNNTQVSPPPTTGLVALGGKLYGED